MRELSKPDCLEERAREIPLLVGGFDPLQESPQCSAGGTWLREQMSLTPSLAKRCNCEVVKPTRRSGPG